MTSALLLLIVLQATGGARTISGVVVDASGVPVPRARVQAQTGDGSAVDTITGTDGAFSLIVPPPGTAVLRVSAAGFADETSTIGRDGAQLRVVLRPRGISEVVDVSANPERLRISSPGSATVLDRAGLAAAPTLALDDQLRSIPGFGLFRRSSSRVANPTTQGATLRGLAASGASRTAVFADGIPLNDPFGGWVYWDRVPAASIERVEVARGGASDLHGTDALGGAIRIGTSSGDGARLWLDAGSHDSVRLSGYAGAGFDRWEAFAAGELATTDGFVVVAPEARGSIDVPAYSEYGSAAAGAGLRVGPRARAAVRGSYFTEDRGNGTPFQINGTIVRQGSAKVDGELLDGLWTARAFGAAQDYDQTFSAVAGDRASERPTSVQHVDASSAGLMLEWLRTGRRFGLLLTGDVRGVNAGLLEGGADPGATFSLTAARQRTYAGAVQLSLQPHPRVSVGTGVRAESWRSTLRGAGQRTATARLLPRATAALRLSDGISVSAGVHRAYRAPTINELYRPFRVGSVLTRANPMLEPEESFGFEAAALLRRGRSAARAAAFWTRLDEAIVNVTLQTPPGAIVRERQNAGRVRAAGFEIEGELHPSRSISITASAAFIDSVFTRGEGLEGLRVPQVPRWQAGAGLQGSWPRATAAVEWRFIGEQFDDDRNLFALARSSMVHARAGVRLRPSVELFAALENALDEEQDVGRTPLRTIGLPRTARVGLRWSR